MSDELTLEVLKSLLEYKEGVFYNKINRSPNAKKGSIAGSSTEYGYSDISVLGKRYKLHRLVWFWHKGKWPINIIDHIDGDRRNNRIENLRDVTASQNAINKKVGRGTTKHGKNGWRARIQFNKQTICLGTFPTEEDAHQAYLEAKIKYHFTDAD